MNLYPAILAYELSNLHPRLVTGQNPLDTINDARLITGISALSPGHIYVCTGEDLARFTDISGLTFAVVDSDQQDIGFLESHGAGGLLIESRLSKQQIFDEIQEILYRYDRIYSAIIHSILRGDNLDSILTQASAFFRNPILLVDGALSIVATSSLDGYQPVPSLESSINSGISSVPLMNELKRRGLTSTLNSAPQAILIDAGEAFGKFISRNFFENGDRSASISIIEADNPLVEEHLLLADQLAELLENVVARQLSGLRHNRKLFSEMMGNMILGKPIDSQIVAANLAHVGWKNEDDYLLLRIIFPQEEKNSGTLEHSKNVYANLFGDCITLTMADTYVIAIHGANADLASSIIQKDLATQLTRDHAFCGISGVYNTFFQLREQYQFAGEALNRVTAERNMVLFQDIIEDYLLSEIASEIPLLSLCRKEIIQLNRYDQENHTELIHSLEVYLQHERSLKSAARELHIHRNSLAYRIQRIEELAKINLNSVQTREQLLFSCKIIRYLQQI